MRDYASPSLQYAYQLDVNLPIPNGHTHVA